MMSQAGAAVPTDVLVIGYGNELRGDDAVGPRVAEAVEAWALPGVQVEVLHQLVPEVAEALGQVRRAIFVDASVAVEETRVERVTPTAAGGTFLPHAGDPATLLSLATLIYGRAAEAWLVQIPAVEFDPGRPFSEATQRGMAVALERIRELLGRTAT